MMLDVPPELDRSLRRHNIDRALLFNFTIPENALARMRSPEYFDQLNVFRLHMVVHEGFHLNVEFPKWFYLKTTHLWPSWDRQPERTEVVKRCYRANEMVLAAFQTERALLAEAFEKIYLQSDTGRGRAAAVEFIKERDQRRELLKEIRIPSAAEPTVSLSCQDAESIMELEEGLLDYVAFSANRSIKGLSRTQIHSWLSKPLGDHPDKDPEPYYRFGTMQMLILESLSNDRAELLRKIGASSGPSGGIEGSLRALLKIPTP